MDDQTQKRLDNVLEDELQKGYRIKTLPPALQKRLADESGVAVQRVRFTRLNPAKRRKIAQVVQRQYHKDLQNPDILSHEQIGKLVAERGEWNKAMDTEMSELQQRTNQEMGALFVTGVAQDNWTDDLLEASAAFRKLIIDAKFTEDKTSSVLSRFDRWLEYTPEQQEQYTALFAEEQNRPMYSPDYDLQQLMTAVPDLSGVDYLQTLDDLRDKLQRYIRLQRDRLRLAELQIKHAKIFSESVEQRRDNTEEMARLYFTAERVDEEGKPAGSLVDEFEQLWDFPEEAVQWFLVEAYFFLNGIPDEAREYLETFGFLQAESGDKTIRSATGESEPSGESPAPQTSKLASNPAEATVSESSAAAAATS